MLKLAIVGYGYWGMNLVRNFFETEGCEILYVCDKEITRLKEVRKRYPSIFLTPDFDEVIADPEVDAVIIATPTKFHHDLAKRAMLAGKDVLVEKPMTLSTVEAKDLLKVAKKTKRIIMVDHTFLFTEAVRKLKEIIDSGEIGKIVYIDSVRVNLGLFQKDSNVAFDLATHDLAIIQYLLEDHPKSVTAYAKPYFSNQEEIFYLHLDYSNKVTCHVHVSWLSPLKIRRMMIVGTKKMIVYDDVEQSEKIKVYDKGVVVTESKIGRRMAKQLRIGYRSGDVWSPNLEIKEALKTLSKEFIEAIESRKVKTSNGVLGLSVVDILEKATESSRKNQTISFTHANHQRR